MAETLHIVNGDATIANLNGAGIGGEIHAWHEAMMVGPHELGLDRDRRLDLRANHLAATYGDNPLAARRDLGRQEKLVDSIADRDEVVLWFEDDLFCHVHLWYLLDRLGDATAPLSLVCGAERLGEAQPDDLARLFHERRPVGAAARRSGAAAWRAFAGDDPRELSALLGDGPLPGLPFAAAALRLHLERFPAVGSGLGRIETRVLRYAAAGADHFGDLFRQFSADEPDYGLGDSQLLLHLVDLARGAQPYLRLHRLADGRARYEPAAIRRLRVEATDRGRAALAGDADFVADNGADTWLGGVRLEGRAVWRWDEAAARLVAP